jgi:hypothetical protein
MSSPRARSNASYDLPSSGTAERRAVCSPSKHPQISGSESLCMAVTSRPDYFYSITYLGGYRQLLTRILANSFTKNWNERGNFSPGWKISNNEWHCWLTSTIQTNVLSYILVRSKQWLLLVLESKSFKKYVIQCFQCKIYSILNNACLSLEEVGLSKKLK